MYFQSTLTRTVNAVFIKDMGSNKHVYRMGGDELVITYLEKSEDEVRKDIEKMKSDLNETKIVCAFGYSMITDGTDFEDALRVADKEMYANKAAIKRAVLEAGGKLHRRASD